MLRGDGGGGFALEHSLDEINAPARTIELIAQKLVGRTGGGAETTVHAGAQNRFRFIALRRATDEIGEVGFHGVALDSGVQAPGVENAGRIEGGLEPLV